MEGRSSAAKKQAYNEYLDSRDKARFKSLAQKLAEHLSKLADDSNSKLRWIWQLIQNAKDVPNEFGKCKIRIEIAEDKLTFLHNGDPFRVSDLQSLIAQYSSKPEENDPDCQTTGKYGTGFITTYILSRKVRIKGIFGMKTEEEKKQAEEAEKDRENQDNEDFFPDLEEQMLNGKNSKALKKFEGGSLYQKFQIYLDRDFKDRDHEFFDKLMKTQRNFLDDLFKNDPKKKWKRKINEFNTQFCYEDLDEPAFKMIKESIDHLKEMFPYVLLFNPKLLDIQVVDHRKGRRIKNFQIKRMPETQENGIQVFHAQLIEEGLPQPKIISLAYDIDEESVSTVGIPVAVEEGKLTLLKVNNKLPNIFKEFPLIGSEDHGFNFVFTSKHFYPNESRSDLLLNRIHGRNDKKISTNWWAIQAIFKKGLSLYKKLGSFIVKGQEHLLIMTTKNQFSQQTHKQYKIRELLEVFKLEVSRLNFIEFKNGRKGSLKELVFPHGISQNKDCKDDQYSIMLNSCFSQLLGESCTLSTSWYQKMFPYLKNNAQYWKRIITVKNVDECMMMFKNNTFKNFVKTMSSEKRALDYLQKLYSFLHHYHPSFITQQPYTTSYQFVLTNKHQFKLLNSLAYGDKFLMKKHNISKQQQQIAAQIGININQYTICDRFADFFKAELFQQKDLLKEYQKIFFTLNKKGVKEIICLGRFLTTFNIDSQCTSLLLSCKQFKGLVDKPFKTTQHDFKPIMSTSEKINYKLLFELEVMYYLNEVINKCPKLFILLEQIGTQSQKNKEAIHWLNQLYRLEEVLLKQLIKKDSQNHIWNHSSFKTVRGIYFSKEVQLIEKTLTVAGTFYPVKSLTYFCYVEDGVEKKGRGADDTDTQFYEKMRQAHNRLNLGAKIDRGLNDQLLHQQILHKNVQGSSFQDIFKFVLQIYKSSSELVKKEKVDILNYIYYLRQITTKQPQFSYKIEVFSAIEGKAFYDYANLTECIDKKQNQAYTFYLMKNPQEIEVARTLTQIYGSLAEVQKRLKKMKDK